MNIVFFGSAQFAIPSLKALISSDHKVSCVVTQPDRQKGRGLHFEGTAIKGLAKDAGLKVYQPEKINTPEAIKFLRGLNADLFVVIAYGQILSQEVLDIPRILPINVHASLLPKYRGAAPINWAIIKGEKITGVTIIKMVKAMDAGEIISQKNTEITDDDTAITLEDKLSCLSADLLIGTLKDIESNNYKLTPQDQTQVSFAPKLKKEDGLIDWNRNSMDIYNFIRGTLGWPTAFTYYNGKLLKVYKTIVDSAPARRYANVPGEISEVSKNGITVITEKDNLIIEELQVEGKKRMIVEEFIVGNKIHSGEVLGNEYM